MKSIDLTRSICSTCNTLENCLLYKPRLDAVIFCEGFDDYTPSQKHSFHYSEGISESAIVSEGTGLCSNCEYKKSCVLTNKSAVTWLCEEHA